MAASRSQQVFLTGGTGFLGSHIGAELLRRGHRVCFMARPAGHLSAEERVGRVLDWHGIGAAERERADVAAGDLIQPGLGLDPTTRRDVLGPAVQIIHCASDTSFVERDRDRIVATNVQGMRHLLDEAAARGCQALHHLSTAYVAGRRSGLCPERLVEGGDFYNVYEETKCRAEWLAWERCQAEGIPLTIYRPAVVYGDSQTGRTTRFDAFYYPMKTAHMVRRLFERDILERGGRRAQEMGIHLDPDGSMFVPVRMETREGGGVNLIPVDYLVAAFLAIMELPPEGKIFHIVNPKLERLEQLVEYTRTYFGLRGLRTCTGAECCEPPRNALETTVDEYLEVYGPYMRDTRIFDRTQSGPILESQGITCPELDYALFRRCIDYALQADWTAGVD